MLKKKICPNYKYSLHYTCILNLISHSYCHFLITPVNVIVFQNESFKRPKSSTHNLQKIQIKDFLQIIASSSLQSWFFTLLIIYLLLDFTFSLFTLQLGISMIKIAGICCLHRFVVGFWAHTYW